MWNKIKLWILFLLIGFFLIPLASARIINIPDSNINNVSMSPLFTDWDAIGSINDVWVNLLTTVKVVLEGVLFIFMVIIWVQMIISMWSDDEALSNSKRQIRYALVALLFINIPGTLYSLFVNNAPARVWYSWWWTWTNGGSTETNLFVNYDLFWNFLWINTNWFPLSYDLVWFVQVSIFAIAVIMIIIAWIKIMTARWKDDVITEWKNKIIFSIIGIIFVWFIAAWRSVVFNGRIVDWVNFFSTLANLALFFAWPIAIFFLTYAWYFLITANGDEERIKKAKNIVINTVIATLILLAAYSFLLDLVTL